MASDREEGGSVPFGPPTTIILACHVRSAALPSARMAPDTSAIRLEQDGLRRTALVALVSGALSDFPNTFLSSPPRNAPAPGMPERQSSIDP